MLRRLIESWSPVGTIAKRECAMILADRRLMLTVLVAPILYALLMGGVYSNHQPNELPIALVLHDQSAYARQLVRMIEASPKLRIAYRVDSEQEMERLMHQGKIDGAVTIPRDFSLRIKRGEDAFVGTYVNASSLIPANTAASALNGVVQYFSLGVEVAVLQKSGMNHEKAVQRAAPVKVSMHPMYNPGFNYSNFMVPGLFITILQQILLMGIALSFSGEREGGSLSELFALSRKPINILIGKSLPYLVISLVLAEIYLRVLFPLNGIPIEGNFQMIFAFTALFILVVVSWGLWVSCFCNTKLFATQVLMFVALPSFVLSGFTWPLGAMPVWVQALSQLLPMTHFAGGFRNLYLAGATLTDVSANLSILVLFLALNIVFAIIGVKRLLRTT